MTKAALDRAIAVVRAGRAGVGHRRGGAGSTSRRTGFRWCASSSATASAPRCTRSRRFRTTARPGRGPRLAEGMVLAIEPMVNAGKPAVKVLGDGWTAVTKDGSLSAHFEHTVVVTEDGCRDADAAGDATVGCVEARWCEPARPRKDGGRRGGRAAAEPAGRRWSSTGGTSVIAHLRESGADGITSGVLVGDRVRVALMPRDQAAGGSSRSCEYGWSRSRSE